MDFAAKDTRLGLVRREAAGLIGLASESHTREAPTACSNWQVRDQVGHMIDATEGYFPGFELARANQESTDTPIGLRAMAARLDERARSHRVLSQSEALDRLQSDLDRYRHLRKPLRRGLDGHAGLAPLAYEPGPVDDLPAVIDFDPASLVLTSYGRIRGGTTRGDAAVADRFRSLSFQI